MPITIGTFRLSPEFFQKTRLTNRCRTNCANECCSEGVWLSVYDARCIIERAEQIQPYLTESLDWSVWDLSKPASLSTPVLGEGTPHEHCCFFTRERRCAIHTFALDKNIPLEKIKPFFCLMFPLTLIDIDINVTEISIDAKAYKTCLVEGDTETWLYEQFESDLRRVIGVEGYAELQKLFPK